MEYRIDKKLIQKHLWGNDIEYAWIAFIKKINNRFTQLDIDLKEEHRYGMVMTVMAAVCYFKQTELLKDKSIIEHSTPRGIIFDIKHQRQENYSNARIGCSEYYLIPKTAVSISNTNKKGYCGDLVWIFDWDDRMV